MTKWVFIVLDGCSDIFPPDPFRLVLVIIIVHCWDRSRIHGQRWYGDQEAITDCRCMLSEVGPLDVMVG